MKTGKNAIIILCAVICMMLCVTAGAATNEEKYVDIYYGTSNSDLVLDMQLNLYKMNYFMDLADYHPGEADESTFSAVERFMIQNGMSGSASDLEGDAPVIPAYIVRIIVENKAGLFSYPTATPVPTATPKATPGPTPFDSQGTMMINEIQTRLNNLGYMLPEEDGNFNGGEFDQATQHALARFCAAIGMNYTGTIDEFVYANVMNTEAPRFMATPAPFVPIMYEARNDSRVSQLQDRLEALGYFHDYQRLNGSFDQETLNALDAFMIENNYEKMENLVIDEKIWNLVFSETAKANPVVKPDIKVGDGNEYVVSAQNRLYDLNYYGDGVRTGVCDEAMMTAVRLFAENNQIKFDGDIISSQLQDALYAENAVKYTPVVEESVGFADWIKENIVLVLVVLVIVAACVFLIIFAFGKNQKGDKQNNSAQTPSYAAKTGGFSAPAAPVAGGKNVELTVKYHGTSNTVTVNLDSPLRIGRSEKTLPLNMADSDISRTHCQLYFRGDNMFLRDYSTNGTSVNGQTYHNCECVVRNHDTIRIGEHEINVTTL